ncbi:MAG: 3-deoxy-7-phosphoheptulonate synthase [Marinoscillum sp.]
MIIHLKKGLAKSQAIRIAAELEALHFTQNDQEILVTSSKLKSLPEHYQSLAEQTFVMDSDIQLASRSYLPKRKVEFGACQIGDPENTLMIAGPCSIESWEQITSAAQLLKNLGLSTLRAGCFKPRTSPYTFQGLGEEGLKMLVKVREEFGLKIITEVKDSTHVDQVIEHTDIIQIGAKAMYDQGILRKCGQIQKPVLLKRGFGSTLQEFVQAAEFILSQGNPNVILCERGIRTFEDKTRFTLDLTGVAYLKEYTNLPIVVDPSHAMGYRYGVPDLTRAAIAMGVDGLLIETHPTPEKALSDAAQQLNFEEFEKLYHSLKPIANAIGRNLI